MEHCHPHHHHEHHSHKTSKKLLMVLVLTSLYMIAEFLGGLYTNSLALTADAGHMLGDVGALALSMFALWLSARPAPVEKTYGYFRVEIFAALINGITLIFIALFIVYEAYLRIISPPHVNSLVMMIIAFGGLIVNIFGAYMLHHGSKENLNIKGAFLHIIGDLLGSIGAIVAGIMMYFWHFYLADPIISIVIAGFVLYSSINLANAAVHILLEAAPAHIDVKEIQSSILDIKDVLEVHDLHIWSINSSNVSLSVHVVSDFQNNEELLHSINNLIKDEFGITHSTIQIEPKGFCEYGCSLNGK